MKGHYRVPKLERYRLAQLIFYSCFDGVERPSSDRHVVRSIVRDINDSAVHAGNVTHSKQRRFRVADDRVSRDVAVHVSEIQSAVHVECLRSNAICLFRGYKFFVKFEEVHQVPRNCHDMFVRISYLQANSIRLTNVNFTDTSGTSANVLVA
jgi:hypothetical protein